MSGVKLFGKKKGKTGYRKRQAKTVDVMHVSLFNFEIASWRPGPDFQTPYLAHGWLPTIILRGGCH